MNPQSVRLGYQGATVTRECLIMERREPRKAKLHMDYSDIELETVGPPTPSILVRLQTPAEYVDEFLGEDSGGPLYGEFVPIAEDEYRMNRRVPDVTGCENGHGPELVLYGQRGGPWYCVDCHLAGYSSA